MERAGQRDAKLLRQPGQHILAGRKIDQRLHPDLLSGQIPNVTDTVDQSQRLGLVSGPKQAAEYLAGIRVKLVTSKLASAIALT